MGKTLHANMYRRLLPSPDMRVRLYPGASAQPLYVVTGANFLSYDQQIHGDEPTHAYHNMITLEGENKTYLMNSGAALAQKLIATNANIILHGRDSLALKTALNGQSSRNNLTIVGGDLATDQDGMRMTTAIQDFSERHKISEVRLVAYQSFAQASACPFKTMDQEDTFEIERAATGRIRFVYNMASVGYWLLDACQQKQLRVVSLSALAATRPSFGLVADSADKVMNETLWGTFHIEANHLQTAPVSVTQINPGITTSGQVYRGQEMHDFIHEEARADGYPLKKAWANLPQISANDVAEVAIRMISGEEGSDPNTGLPNNIRQCLYGGYDPEDLKTIFERYAGQVLNGMNFSTKALGPDHLFASHTRYGRLPRIKMRSYNRISLTPPGQLF